LTTPAGTCDHRGRCVRARGDVWASIAPFQFPTARWTSQKLSLGPVWLGLFCAKGLAARCRFPPGRAEWPRRQKKAPHSGGADEKDFARGEGKKPRPAEQTAPGYGRFARGSHVNTKAASQAPAVWRCWLRSAAQRLAVVVAHDEARAIVFYVPRRREPTRLVCENLVAAGAAARH